MCYQFHVCVGILWNVGIRDGKHDATTVKYAADDMTSRSLEILELFGSHQLVPRKTKFALVHPITNQPKLWPFGSREPSSAPVLQSVKVLRMQVKVVSFLLSLSGKQMSWQASDQALMLDTGCTLWVLPQTTYFKKWTLPQPYLTGTGRKIWKEWIAKWRLTLADIIIRR